ncbi:MAG: response regulator [Gemmatimonadales bacterium]
MRILVVDDEPMVLGAIKRLLLTFRPTPEVIAEPGGASAVARMTDEQFDLIITDMEMPGMNGAAVLAHVRENYPHMVRVVLSGYAEPASGLQAVALAHRYLAKPCTVQDLSETIRSAREIHDALEPPDVRTAITGLTALPTAPPL